MFDWSDVTRRFKDLASLIDTKPVFRWGVITNEDPLLVQLDGDDRPIAGSPSTIIGGLAAGERVLCLIQNRRVTVLGRGGAWENHTPHTLWTGVRSMLATHTETLSEPISSQKTGIVLVWSAWSNGAANYDFNYSFVPKAHIDLSNGGGVDMALYFGTAQVRKYVYVHDTQLIGQAGNGQSPSSNLILREVIGV